MRLLRRPAVAWSVLAAVAAAIALLTLLPSFPPIGPPPFEGFDKLAHGIAWFGLGAAAWPAARNTWDATARAAWLAWAIATTYGAAVELGQLLVPGRSAEWLDLAADAAGAALGVIVARRLLG